MKTPLLAIIAGGFLFAACSEARDDANAGSAAGNDGMSAEAPLDAGSIADPAAALSAAGPGTALGLTTRQLEDADLLDVDGRDLGDVERVMADASGEVTALRVEIDDSEPDRFVEIPVAGLAAVRDESDDDPDDDDWDVRADLTRDALMAMPEAR